MIEEEEEEEEPTAGLEEAPLSVSLSYERFLLFKTDEVGGGGDEVPDDETGLIIF